MTNVDVVLYGDKSTLLYSHPYRMVFKLVEKVSLCIIKSKCNLFGLYRFPEWI